MSKHAPDRLAQRYARIKAELQDLGYICIGSVQSRRLRCGTETCRCHQDEAFRHGPYRYWTRKVGGKTVSRVLTDDQFVLYRVGIENNRKLVRLVRQMHELSARAMKLAGEGKIR